MTVITGTGSTPHGHEHAAAAQAVARDQIRQAAAQWLTADQITTLGRQMVLSITRYQQGHRRPPTWAEALAGVDPILCQPMTTVPGGWPLAPRCGCGSCGNDSWPS